MIRVFIAAILTILISLSVLTPPIVDVRYIAPVQPAETIQADGFKPAEPLVTVAAGCARTYNYDWPQPTAYAVCMGESGGDHTRINWGDNHRVCIGSYGLMQVGCLHVSDPDTLLDPSVNLDVAYSLYLKEGWQPWSAYKNGSYLKYMN